MEGKAKICRIGEKTKDVGPESAWGKDVPLYKLRGNEYAFQFDFVCTAFANKNGANGRYVHMKGYFVNGEQEAIPGPNGETGDIAISTGAQTILARLDSLDPDMDFPTIGRFASGGTGKNQWFDYE